MKSGYQLMPFFSKSAALGLALSGLLLASPFHVMAAPQRTIIDIDRIVVIVNDDVITHSELAQRLQQTKKQLELENISAPPDPALK
ncbi:MAG TPA: hypothetical protein VFU39_01800, partial [Sulfuricaulis sp.]|nr:hypothetical protein [Sulfuricaulis sp.]